MSAPDILAQQLEDFHVVADEVAAYLMGNAIPDAGCKRRMLTPKWFAPFIIAILYVGLLVIFLIGCDELHVPSRPLGYIAVALLSALLVTLAIVFVRKRSDSAYGDPALLEKRFKSVLNDAVYAELAPYGLERIHIGSEA